MSVTSRRYSLAVICCTATPSLLVKSLPVVNLVQDDFDKIIVITHLKELKEAFPVRIEVEKDPVAGSRFEMHGV